MKCDLEKVPNVGLFGMLVHQSGLRAQKMFDKYGLNKSQASILFMLHHEESVSQKPLSQKELAKKLNVTAPSITSAIQKMERAEFIKRAPDENDQRIMRLYLDEKGKSCIEHVKEVTRKMDEIMFRGISQEEQLFLRRLLIQMFENLSQEECIQFHTAKETKKTDRTGRESV